MCKAVSVQSCKIVPEGMADQVAVMCTQTESEQDGLQERVQAIQAQQEELREIRRVTEPQARCGLG